jgi:hypothetical protein
MEISAMQPDYERVLWSCKTCVFDPWRLTEIDAAGESLHSAWNRLVFPMDMKMKCYN